MNLLQIVLDSSAIVVEHNQVVAARRARGNHDANARVAPFGQPVLLVLDVTNGLRINIGITNKITELNKSIKLANDSVEYIYPSQNK
jgi:hypothetical protein